MKIHIILEHKFDGPLMEAFASILRKEDKIMALLDDVIAKVANLGTVEDSIITMLADTNAKLAAAIATGDMAKVQALSDAIDAQTAKMSAAAVANTPAAPIGT